MKKLHTFKYLFNAGAVSKKELEKFFIDKGNCRLAIQDYLYQVEGIYLSPSEIMLPNGYKNVGKFIKQSFENNEDFFNDLERGTIIYAEKLRNKKNENIYKDRIDFPSEVDWVIAFHTAIFIGKLDEKIIPYLPIDIPSSSDTDFIWHASFISGKTALWSKDQFVNYYRPIAAKKVTK